MSEVTVVGGLVGDQWAGGERRDEETNRDDWYLQVSTYHSTLGERIRSV